VETINDSHDAEASSVTAIFLRQDNQGYKHQSLLVQTKIPESDLWIRLGRAAGEQRAGIFSRSSTFVPNDTATLAVTQEKLTTIDGKAIATLNFRGPNVLSLFTLNLLLSVFISAAKTYVAATENCWFFCSILLSVLSKKYSPTIEGSWTMWTTGLFDSGHRIEALFLEKIHKLIDKSDNAAHAADFKKQLIPVIETLPSVLPTPLSSLLFYESDQAYFGFSYFSPHSVKWGELSHPTAWHLFHFFQVHKIPPYYVDAQTKFFFFLARSIWMIRLWRISLPLVLKILALRCESSRLKVT
jgi:hypothetical protein